MFRPDVFSRLAAKASLLISAIAGSVLVASVAAPTSFESQMMQLDAPPTNAEPFDLNPGAVAIAVWRFVWE